MWDVFIVMALCFSLAFGIHFVIIKTLFGHQDAEFFKEYENIGDDVPRAFGNQRGLRTIDLTAMKSGQSKSTQYNQTLSSAQHKAATGLDAQERAS